MKKITLILMFFAAVALFGFDKTSAKAADDMNNAANLLSNTENTNLNADNQKAPNFTLIDTQGKKVSLSDFKGKVVIVDFWATWCPPCRRGIPDLIAIKKEYKNKVVIIGISLDLDTKKDVIPFIKNYGINYPVVYGNNEVVQAYGNIEAIPTSFVIDKNGKIVNQHVGLTPKETYINEIKKLLGKS